MLNVKVNVIFLYYYALLAYCYEMRHEGRIVRTCLLTGGEVYFSYIVAVIFIGGGKPSTQRQPLTCWKLLTNFIT